MSLSSSQIQEWISRLVLEVPENCLSDFGGVAIFGPPLIGIADGDDPIFKVFRAAVSPLHFLPGEILHRYFPHHPDEGRVSVISWAMPFNEEIRQSNREVEWPSSLYSVARNNGGALNFEVSRGLIEILNKEGICSVSPLLLDEYDAFRSSEHIFSSTWSERHVAYATGLGRFGLNGSLISPAGANVRLGSVIAQVSLPSNMDRDQDFRAPCLANGGGDCGLCQERCPVQAITKDGLDKSRCYARRQVIRDRSLQDFSKKYHLLASPIIKSGVRETGFSFGCALCQCGVPCQSTNPFLEKESR